MKWFKSYLTSRRQRVLANNVYSSAQRITQGVPQGSVLGPLFYILYANDITNIVKHCNIALYADDTVLYTANPSFETSITNMCQDMCALRGWCGANGIQMNTEKTKLMLFGSTNGLSKLPPVNISLDGAPIHTVTNYKYLGITLDGQLNYSKHIRKLVSSASLKLKQFKRMRSFLNTKAATLVYKNMLLPMLEYGDIFLSGANMVDKKKLQVLQNKGLRCALNRDQFASTDELHEDVDLLKLKFRREQHLLNHMYDMSKGESNLKSARKAGVRTRASKKKLLKIVKPRTEKFKKSWSYVGPRKWNALPVNIHGLDSKAEFKSGLLAHIKERLKVIADLSRLCV